MTTPITDVLQLEFETDPPAGQLRNLVQNPSGELGGWGWLSPVSGSRISAGRLASTGETVLLYNNVADTPNWFTTEALPVREGQYVTAAWRVYSAFPWAMRARLEWINAAGAVAGSTDQGPYFWTNATQDLGYGPAQAPAGAVAVRLRFDVYNDETGADPFVITAEVYFGRVAVVASDTATAVGDVGLPPSAYYANILGPTHTLVVERQELDMGTLTGTIVSASLDPAVAEFIRPGRRVRLRVRVDDNPERWEVLFAGKARKAEVTYDLLQADAERRAKITLTAVDAVAVLAQQARPEGVGNLEDLHALLEGAGVPWEINGSGSQTGVPPVIVATNEQASLADQVAIARDSARGYAWVSRDGILRAYDAGQMPNYALLNGDDSHFDRGPGSWTQIAAGTGVQHVSAAAGWDTIDGEGSVLVSGPLAGGDMGIKLPPQHIPVQPDRDYRLGAKFRAYTAGASRYPRLMVTWYDVDAEAISTDLFDSATPDNTSTAIHVEGVFTAPSSAVSAQPQLVIRGTAGGEMVGEQHFMDTVTFTPDGDPLIAATLDEDDYGPDIVVDYATDRAINEVTVNLLRQAGDRTETVVLGPYRDEQSIREWDVHSKTFTVQGIPEAEVPAYAAAILAENAIPPRLISSVSLAITEANLERATLDLYDQVQVSNDRAGLTQTPRIVGVRHTITAVKDRPEGKWLMQLDFVPDGAVASPQMVAMPPINNRPETVEIHDAGITTLVADGNGDVTVLFNEEFPAMPVATLNGYSSGVGLLVAPYSTSAVGVTARFCHPGGAAAVGATITIHWQAYYKGPGA